jgi:hypothetical protein
MKCSGCLHWQGNKYSEWGDCYRVISKVKPDLSCCYLLNESDIAERYFEIPFDPHDYKYWSRNPYWRTLYEDAIDEVVVFDKHPGVRVVTHVKDDIVFDAQNGERVGKLRLHYFQTNKEYTCDKD